MATRSPPPLVSAPHGPIDRPTTTISTIVVKAGDEAFITVGLLQSGEFARLRIDEMRPPLLSIGRNEDENGKLLKIHQNLLNKLAMKEEECEALLARAAALPAEKELDEAVVYTAMAASLDCTWRELLRRLHLRENLLVDISEFYRLLSSHQEVSRVCISSISSLTQSQSPDGLARQIGVSVNEIVEITARAMELGSSVMGQLRILGELSDNEKREEEIYQSMLVIEGAMLKMASEWSRVEDSWVEEKKKRVEMSEKTGGDDIDREMEEIGLWLAHAGKRLKASTEEGMKTIVAEAEEQRTRLISIISQTEDDRKLAKAGELARGVEELLALTRAALNKGSRLRNFFVSATNMYQQLCGMERDMENANESMAGELAPLARQKGANLKEEADAIIERERVTHDEKRMVVNKKNEIMEKIEQIERIAREKCDSGKLQARENLRRGHEWLVREGEPWMMKNGEMGGTRDTTNSFVERHSLFGETIVANDSAIQFALQESTRLTEDEQRSAREFEERYNRLKSQLEQRLYIGKTFQQVQEFARELEVSFDSLETLIDQKAEHSERGLQQMGKVFEMIEETLGQERTQGDRFISTASSLDRTDSTLKTTEARESVREILVRHERRFSLMSEKWMMWHQRKRSMVDASRSLEEVQMWQEECVEIIRLWEEEKREEKKEEVSRRVEEVKRRMDGEKEKMLRIKQSVDDEITVKKVERTMERQKEIEERMREVEKKLIEEERFILEKRQELESARSTVLSTIEEVQRWQEETEEIIRLWEIRKDEKKEEERKETMKRCDELKIDLIRENDKIDKVKGYIRDEETSQTVLETVLRQREISERIDRVKRRLDEEEKIEEDLTKQEEERSKRTVEEISMWQEEIMTILRLWEDYRMKRSLNEKEAIDQSIEAIRMDSVVQTERLHSAKINLKQDEWQSRISSVEEKQAVIGERLEKIQIGMREEAERQKEQKEELKRSVEEIFMWQDETVEIIRLWEEKKIEEKKVEVERLHARMEEVNERIRQYGQVVNQMKDEETTRIVEKVAQRQNEIVTQVRKVKEETEKEVRRQQELEQEEKKSLEEIDMWQDETVEIVRLWEEKKMEVKIVEVEKMEAKIEEVDQKIRQHAQIVHNEETSIRLEKMGERQNAISIVVKKVKEETEKEIKMKEEEQFLLRKTLEEIEMWQDETVEIIRLWGEKKIEEKKIQIEEVCGKMEEVNDRIKQSIRVVRDDETARRVEKIAQKQNEIGSRVQIVREETRQEDMRMREEKLRLTQTMEEIEMWQDESVEIIRLWGEKKIEVKKVQIEEMRGKIEEVNERIRQIVKEVKDEESARRVERIAQRQNEINSVVRRVKEEIEMEERSEEERQLQLRKTLEEIEMWQDETVEIIRLWGEKKIEVKKIQVETISGKMEEVNDRIRVTVQHVKDEESARRVERIAQRQNEINSILKKMKDEVENEERIVKEEQLQLKKILEEVEMWQNETVEIIRLWGEKKVQVTKIQVEEIRGKMEDVNEKIRKTVHFVKDEETARRVERIEVKQREIEELLNRITQQLTKEEELLAVETVREIIERPKIISQLVDISIEEGKRVEFVAKIQSKPEATIMWLKDGKDIQQSMDYRKSYVNGVATLTIEETFIEDSARYTLKAMNEGGETESSATLTVTSVRRDIEAPRVVRGLQSRSLEEGEELFLDCVVVAQPEPTVVWFKEESTIKEDERTQLHFKGDHCSLLLSPTTVSDSGMYSAKAKNVHGEATSLCQVKVSPKKIPPPTPPKPDRPDSRLAGPVKPPSMQCTLTNETYQEGMKAVLQVLVCGTPTPTIQWFINDTPISSTERIKVTVEENGWTRVTIDEIREEDAGLYMVVAENEIGEARTGATIHVQPKLKMTQIKQSFEEASGSEQLQTVIDNHPRSIDERITVVENRVETTQALPTHSIVMETRTNDVEEFKQKEEEEREVRPVEREEINTKTTTITTTSTSHIPIASTTRTKKEELVQGEIGLSNTSTAPDVIRPLHSEYTVNESEELLLEVLLVANPRPKVQWFFNDRLIPPTSQFAEMKASGDSYSLRVKKSALENAGYYRIRVENVRGVSESLCIVHIRPAALGPVPKTKQHVTVQEEFAMFEYEQRRPDFLYESRIPTLKNGHASSQNNQMMIENKKSAEYLEGYDLSERERVGNPPHFTQTLLSTVTADGSGAKFEGVVTGWPAPEMEWAKDGVIITRNSHPHITLSNIGGRVSLNFVHCGVEDSGKYKCTASNEWGVATSSAQLVVRPKTVAPDFISRLISEEVGEGETLKWTIRVSGDPLPSVVWLRDGIIIPNCDEVKIIDEGDGVHSMVIHAVEMADSGQFTCLAENSAGEARSTADLVVRPEGAEPGHYFHVTKVTQEKQIKGQSIPEGRNETFAIESPMI